MVTRQMAAASPTKPLLASTGGSVETWSSTAGTIDRQPRSACTSKNLYRTSVLILLGLILLSPFAFLKSDIVLTIVQVGDAVRSTQSTRTDGALLTFSEHQQQLQQQQGEGTRRRSGGCAPVDSDSTLDGFFDVPNLEILGEWTSKKVLDLNASISIVTQLSIDRLSMLENQCRSWDDALVAVIYVPLEQGARNTPYGLRSSTSDIERSIGSFFSLMESTPSTCALHIQLVGQRVEDERSSPYPINALRNRAMDLAQSPLVFVLDVDFVAAPNLGLPGAGYRDASVYGNLVRVARDKGAIVVPAFELTNKQMEPYIGENVVKNLVVEGKDVLRKAYKQELIDAFNARDFEAGHGPTNTSKWIRLRDPRAMYRVEYQPKYEPFVILAREIMPHADERFVGYGANKLVFIRSLEALGFTFHVHGSAFAIHVPHPKTKMANIFIAHRKGSTRDPMDVLRDLVERKLDDGHFEPVVRDCKRM